MIKTHSSGSLHYRFENHSGQFIAMLIEQPPHRLIVGIVPFSAKLTLRRRREKTYRKGGAESPVHAGNGIAHRHGVPCVSMVSGANGGKIGALRVVDSLHSHFHRHLGGYRTGIGIKDMIHRRRQNLKKQFSQIDSRLMRESAKHHMAHAVDLLFSRLIEYGMIITVNHAPPR